jgi:hypothetical protein
MEKHVSQQHFIKNSDLVSNQDAVTDSQKFDYLQSNDGLKPLR